MVASLPITCVATIVIASDWVGLTLPGIIELPGSFAGMRISPIPQRGPDASQRTSLAIFMQAAASCLSAPLAATKASWLARAANLFGALTNWWPLISLIFAATNSAYSGWVLSPVPTAVPPSAISRN